MKNLFFFVLAVTFFLSSCTARKNHSQKSELADRVENVVKQTIDMCILKHGGARYKSSWIEFDFRGQHFVATRYKDRIKYESRYEDDQGNEVQDILDNDGFFRLLNKEELQLNDQEIAIHSNSLQASIYFALLPSALDDPALVKQYVGTTQVKGVPYVKIKVSAKSEENLSDPQEEYLYWIHKEHFTMDYFAYNFHDKGGGARFREAINSREINGIRFSDYINYKPKEPTLDIVEFDRIFEEGGMMEVSRFIYDNISVIEVEGDQ